MTDQPDQTSAELLACPFCGGEARVVLQSSRTTWGVECRKCGAEQARYGNEGAAIRAWNARQSEAGELEWLNVMPREVVARYAFADGCREATAAEIRGGLYAGTKLKAEMVVKMIGDLQEDTRAALRQSAAPASEAGELIREAARLIEPGEGEAVFYIRVGGSHTQCRVKAAKGVEPAAVVEAAFEVLRNEYGGVETCPLHRSRPSESAETVELLREAYDDLRRYIYDKTPERRERSIARYLAKLDAQGGAGDVEQSIRSMGGAG